jgi:hypothetical protein
MPFKSILSRYLDWVDNKTRWQFLAIQYTVRWIILLPIILFDSLFPAAAEKASIPLQAYNTNPVWLFALLVIISPLLETLIECSLPYAVISFFKRKEGKLPRRAWSFIITSAFVMVILHLSYGPAVLLPSLITGIFLAYTYSHFAADSLRYAFGAAVIFHSSINIVGFIIIILGI